MKATDILKKAKRITPGATSFFIAEEDFTYDGVKILKNSLVFYYGDKILKINKIDYGIFQEKNHSLFNTPLIEDEEKGGYPIEKCSSCDREETFLKRGWRGLWHENHFDKWTGSYQEYLSRIKDEPSLEYDGIRFSSIMYEYNSGTKMLEYFISVSPFSLKVGDSSIMLPEFLEVCRSGPGYLMMPLNGNLNYFGIELTDWISLMEDGTIHGDVAVEFEAEIYGYPSCNRLIITEYFPIFISITGSLQIELLNEASNKVEKFHIKKI